MVGAWSLGFGYNHYVWTNGFQQGDRNLRENTITVATVMKTDVLRSVGGFNDTLTTGMEDWDLWLRMADNGHWGYTLEEFHFWYRVSPPGKWSMISNTTLFQNYVDERKIKYSKYVLHIANYGKMFNEPFQTEAKSATPYTGGTPVSSRPKFQRLLGSVRSYALPHSLKKAQCCSC